MEKILPVQVLDQFGKVHLPTEDELQTLKQFLYCHEAIEPGWVRGITANVPEEGGVTTFVLSGYYLDNINDPFQLVFRTNDHAYLAKLIRHVA